MAIGVRLDPCQFAKPAWLNGWAGSPHDEDQGKAAGDGVTLTEAN